MALKVLDDAAQRILQDAVKLINQRPPYSPTRPPFNPDSPSLDTNSTPEVYVCRIPEGGLPGLSLADILVGTSTSTSASSPETLYEVQGVYCQVYQVDNKDGVLRQVPGNTPYVYNLSSSSIPEDTWVIVVKDNYGDWYAIASVIDTSIGTGTGTHEHIGGTPCNFAYLDAYDCTRINTTDPHGNDFDTYLKYDSGHWTSADIFNYVGGSGTFDFYYLDGRFHLKLDNKELLDCSNGCFTGAWITRHWAQLGDGDLGSSTASGTQSNPQCSGPTFTVCIECSCCPVDGWEGSGYYCVIIPGFTGTGTNFIDCEPVFLDDDDKCSDIIICSGKYDTIEEVLAACDNATGTGTTVIIPIIGGSDCTTATNVVVDTTYSVSIGPPHSFQVFHFAELPLTTYKIIFTGDIDFAETRRVPDCLFPGPPIYSASINPPSCIDFTTGATGQLVLSTGGFVVLNGTFRIEIGTC